MPMSLAIPASTYPRLGPGCQCTVNGMTGAVAGHKLAIEVSLPSSGPILTFGGAVIPGSSGSGSATLGVLGPGYTSLSGLYSTNNAGAADGDSVEVYLLHYDASFSLQESQLVTGRVWDPTSFLPKLLQELAAGLALSAEILAAVKHTYSSP